MNFLKNRKSNWDDYGIIIDFDTPNKEDYDIIKAVGPTKNLGVVDNPAPIAFLYIGKSRIELKPMYRVLGVVPIDSTLQSEFNKLTGTTEPIEFMKQIY
jgi:hypothetical protein